MSSTLIRLPEVQRRTGYSKVWLYRLLGENRFPKPVKIGSRSILPATVLLTERSQPAPLYW
ncbi:MAG: AlpA family phage regulatory protein [Pseudomonadota bacterium]